jgi:hypothetical protein
LPAVCAMAGAPKAKAPITSTDAPHFKLSLNE